MDGGTLLYMISIFHDISGHAICPELSLYFLFFFFLKFELPSGRHLIVLQHNIFNYPLTPFLFIFWNLFLCFIGRSLPIFGKTKGGWFCSGVVSTVWTVGLEIDLCINTGDWPTIFVFLRSKLQNYDDVVERVAHQVGLDDPSKIRLTSHNCLSQQPKPTPIKYRGVQHLVDMLIHYSQVTVLFSFSFWVYIPSFLDWVLDICHKWLTIFPLLTDFWYFVLWSLGYPSPRTARSKEPESCFLSCNKGWSVSEFLATFL